MLTKIRAVELQEGDDILVRVATVTSVTIIDRGVQVGRASWEPLVYEESRELIIDRPDPPNHMEEWCNAAREIGRDHARSAATWVTDGNDSDESRREKLRTIVDGDPLMDHVLPKQPNLSGEYADSFDESQLLCQVEVGEVTIDQVNEIVQAYLEGVDEEFVLACERELMKWLED